MKCLDLLSIVAMALHTAACLWLNSPETVVEDRADVLELNSLYDEQGRLVFDQVIFYEWSLPRERWQVRAWRLVKDQHQRPEYDHDRGEWVCIWQDGDILRRVSAMSFRRTWTQYDPELCEREILCKDKRRELSHPAAARPR